MSGSYEKINYSLRPAKSIERKMMCDAFRRLSEFGQVESYRYIGFGSTYFSDFNLFHKNLGIGNMISIEKDEENNARFEFNRPFSCIDIKFGESHHILPTLLWNSRSIVWLDYDKRLNQNVLADIDTFSSQAVPGSLLVISVCAVPYKPDPRKKNHRLEVLKKRVGEDHVPLDIEDEDLAIWGTARIYRRIIINQIEQSLRDRNAGRYPGNKMLFKQIFNFHYSDGTQMLTVGIILYDEGQTSILAKCAFEKLSFVRFDEEPYLIEVPNLTYREIRHLDRQIPADDVTILQAPGIPHEDLEKYLLLYRYFPMFTEAEF